MLTLTTLVPSAADTKKNCMLFYSANLNDLLVTLLSTKNFVNKYHQFY
jgi:hypothetical protein